MGIGEDRQKLELFNALKGAFTFPVRNFSAIIRVMWLPVLIYAASNFLFWSMFRVSILDGVLPENEDPLRLSGNRILFGLSFYLVVLSLCIIWIGLARLRFGLISKTQWIYLRFKWQEARFLVFLILAFGGISAIALPASDLAKFLNSLLALSGDNTLVDRTISVLVFALSLTWLAKISLGAVIVVNEKRFALWRSLVLTRGHTTKILTGLSVVMVVASLLGVLFLLLDLLLQNQIIRLFSMLPDVPILGDIEASWMPYIGQHLATSISLLATATFVIGYTASLYEQLVQNASPQSQKV